MFEEKLKQFKHAMLVLDILFTIGSFSFAYAIRELLGIFDGDSFFSHISLLPLIVAVWGFFLFYFEAYRSPRNASFFTYAWAIIRAVVTGIVLLLALLYILDIHYVSRPVVIAFGLVNILTLILTRVAFTLYFKESVLRGENHLKVLIVGTGNRARTLAETLMEKTKLGLKIVGYLDPDASLAGAQIAGSPVLGTIDDITSILKNHVIDEVILAVPRAMISDVDRIALSCEEEGVKLRMMADVFDVHVARMRLVELGNIPLLTLEPVALDEWKLLAKRVFDIVTVTLSLPLILPLMGAIAIAVKWDSRGPVFFTQDRVGLSKRVFRMFKFRTMIEGGDQMQEELEHLNEAKGPIFKIANDPRITKVGKFLRKTSLDEVPQLFNVLRGEMSLVGPRPMSLRDVDLFDRGIQRKRFSVKPGLTCIWQISGRSSLPFTKWLELDLQYIENWSFGLDILILLKTIPVVLKGTGAV